MVPKPLSLPKLMAYQFSGFTVVRFRYETSPKAFWTAFSKVKTVLEPLRSSMLKDMTVARLQTPRRGFQCSYRANTRSIMDFE